MISRSSRSQSELRNQSTRRIVKVVSMIGQGFGSSEVKRTDTAVRAASCQGVGLVLT